MKKVVKIEANDKKEAVSLAKKEFLKDIDPEKFNESNISVKLLKENKGLLFLKGKPNLYQLSYDDSLSRADENFLDIAMDTINVDGSFSLKIVEDGVFLKISEPKGKGRRVDYSDIKNFLEQKEIVEIDWQAVREIIEKAEDQWQLIAPRKPELDREAELLIKISDDKLKAFLTYNPSLGGKKLTYT
ncbi:MAG: hypothetical protein ACOCRU_01595, partial [bacterium]